MELLQKYGCYWDINIVPRCLNCKEILIEKRTSSNKTDSCTEIYEEESWAKIEASEASVYERIDDNCILECWNCANPNKHPLKRTDGTPITYLEARREISLIID